MNTNKSATRSVNRKLLAALAVLAVAFVVLAAVPAVATDSDAATTNTVYVDPTAEANAATLADGATYLTVYDALKTINTTSNYVVKLKGNVSEPGFTIGYEGSSTARSTATSAGANVKIDLGGYTLTITAPGVGSSDDYATQGIRNVNATVTIENGTIKAADNNKSQSKPLLSLVNSHDSLTLRNVTLDGSNIQHGNWNAVDLKDSYVTLMTDNGTVNIEGNTAIISSDSDDYPSYALVVDDNHSYSSGSNVTINTDGQIQGVAMIRDGSSDSGTAGVSSLTITKGTFIGGIDVFGGDTIPSSSNAVLGEFSGKLTVNGTVSVDVTFMGQNNDLTVTSDGSYSGKVSYTDQQGVTSSAVFSKLTAGTVTSGPLTAGSLTIEDAELASKGTITVASGTVELGSDLDLSTNGSLTVASGATLKVQSGSDLTGTTSPKNITNNGRIDVADAADVATTNTFVSGNKAVSAVAVQYDESKNAGTGSATYSDIVVFGDDTVAALGETVRVDILSVTAGYKIQSITVASSAATAEFAAFTATEKDGNFYFVVPAAATQGVTVFANIVGALSATFYIEYAADDIVVGATIQNIEPNTSYAGIKAMLPAISVRDGYRIAQWYSDAALTSVEKFTGTVTAATGSVSFYAGVTALYDVDYSGVTGQGTVTVSPAQAAFKDVVTVSYAAANGWEFGSIKITYVDAKGVTQTVSTSKIAGVDGYTFVMPEADVTVAVTFLERFDLVIPAYGEDATSYAEITISSIKTSKGVTSGVISVATMDEDTDAKAASIKGNTVTLAVGTITPSNYIVKEFVFTGANGKKVDIDVKKTTAGYTFTMPTQDVTLTVEYGPSQVLTITNSTTTEGKTTVKSAGSTVANGDKVAVGAEVVVTTAPTAKTASQPTLYGLKSIAIVGADGKNVPYTQDGNKYTFTMPDQAVTVTTVYAQAYTVSGVAITSAINGGSVDYSETAAAAVVAGNTFSFSIQLRDGYSLKSITATTTVTVTDGTVSITPAGSTTAGTYTLAYPYVAANSSTASIFTYDEETGTVTMLMPAGNVTSVVFTFETTTYYTVTLNAGENGTIVLYSDKDCKTVLEDALPDVEGFQVKSGTTVYVKVAADGDGSIESINATYEKYVEAGVNASGATVPAHYDTTELPLGIVSSLSKNDDKFGIYSFKVIGDTTINATFAKSALQIAKDAANEYIQSVQKSASMSETIVGYDATWAAQADKDVSVFTIALNAVAAATTVADVNAAQTTFDTNLLAYMKSTSLSYLETAYNNGTAYEGYALAYADYNTARTAINAVVLDDDKTVQDEVDAVVAAYDAAMNARTSVTPTPEPGTYAASIDAALSANGLNLMVVSSDDGKLIQKGTVTIAVTYSYTAYDALLGKTVQDTDTFTFTYTLSADSGYAYIPVDYSGIDSSRTVVGASAAVSIDSLSATTAVQGFTLA